MIAFIEDSTLLKMTLILIDYFLLMYYWKPKMSKSDLATVNQFNIMFEYKNLSSFEMNENIGPIFIWFETMFKS